MKTFITFSVLLLLLSLNGLNAQTGLLGNSVIPLKPQSPLFGKDIVINDLPDRNQRNIAICSAFNGWLFAVYSYPIGNEQAIAVFKSTDNGINWELLGEGSMIVASLITRLDIIACGNSIDDLKIFIGYVYFIATLNTGGAYVIRYKAEPFGYEDELLKQDGGIIKDLALSSDYMYPCVNSNPYSIGVLYSKSGVIDTLVFRSSSNGGMSLDSRRKIATSPNFFHKVSLNYGRSSSWNSGRYFAAWEEQVDQYSSLGHVYTAHSEPNFDSPFTKAVCLDSLDSSAINKVRNPINACQYNNADNDSANLTEVVLFEKYKPSGGDYDVTGFYNLQATTTSHFRPLSIAATTNNELQPDINFNPYSSAFMMTYFDSTDKKLPFLTNNVNLVNPDSWNIISQAYNDNSNLIAPYPKVKLNIGQQDGINAWIAEGTGGNGVAMFDAPYSTYTGISGNNTGSLVRLIGSYPNPCSNEIKIAFELKKTGKVTINVLSILGQSLGTVTDQYYSEGRHVVQYYVSDFPAGTYFYNFRVGDFTASGKFTVVR